jgi:sugar phosphate isomerase/epimerase
MVTLGYEMTTHTQATGGDYVDVKRQLSAAAAAGFSWFGADIWSIRNFRDRGGQLSDLHQFANSRGIPQCGQLQSVLLGVERDPQDVPFAILVDDLVEAARILQPATIQVIVAKAEGAIPQFQDAAGRLRGVAPDAVFALESIPGTGIDSIGSALEFIDATGIDRFGLNLDSWHFFHGPDGWPELESLTSEEIVQVQFSDGPASSADAMQTMMTGRVLPGDGELDLRRFVATMRDIGFDGRVGVEITSSALRSSLSPEQLAVEVFRHSYPFWMGSSPDDEGNRTAADV